VTFFRGRSLKPLPPGESKTPQTRYLDFYEDDTLDEQQLTQWIAQAAAIPGWDGGSPRNGGIPLQGTAMKKSAATPDQSASAQCDPSLPPQQPDL